MTYSKGILTIIGILFCFAAIGQSDTIIKKGFVNFATLIVDYETYEFEGGNISYYECTDCDNQSIPFLVDYQSPGDFGGITFHLEPTMDILFDATIVWAGQGQISYPSTYDLTSPFSYIDIPITEPSDIQYINTDGEEMDDSYLLSQAQLVWDAVDSLEITNQFADKDFKAAIYFYPPSVGVIDPAVAKWIVFLYYSDMTSSTDNFRASDIEIYPNPAQDILNMKQVDLRREVANYRIYSHSGTVIKEGGIADQDHQIDISSCAAGLYFVEFRDRAGKLVGSEKFVKE